MSKYSLNKVTEINKLLEYNRIQILRLLLEDDTCVCQMVEKLDLKHNLVSHHLKTLLDLSYITNRKNGQHRIYHLKNSKRDTVESLFKILNI